MLMIFILITLLISSAFIFLNILLQINKMTSLEKNSPFECGFNNFKTNRLPFSINFFIITLIFLIFDVEITLIFPLIPLMLTSLNMSFLTTSIIMMILIISIYFEWKENSIKWIS
uniref:NADH-ubiquinone oxidoreductase chain 3 n=1 Tax=Prosevania sp. ZJUH_2016031 TaxID=2491170 RepID=A0A3Q8UAC3_9HYME|nr:NADH dehydrogenase subunit 3 [Prosevania sp. ZJUH_2016031]